MDIDSKNYKELAEMKWQLESMIRHVNQRLGEHTLVHCTICGIPGVGHFSTPEGWGWLRMTPGYLLCDGCIKKWTHKFGEPELYREEDEI